MSNPRVVDGLNAARCVSTAILVAYTAYTVHFSAQKVSFRNFVTASHNAPGLIIAYLGTFLWIIVGCEILLPSPESQVSIFRTSWFWGLLNFWLLNFLVNTVTGFFMIPQLPNVDPAVKREFSSLVLCQMSFVPAILGLVVPDELVRAMEFSCYGVCGLGLIFSVSNFVLYVLDYLEGRSNSVCSGDYLVAEMEKQHEHRHRVDGGLTFSHILHDYIAIAFKRGSEKTRMPANRVMIFIAITLIIPFPAIAATGLRFETLRSVYPREFLEAPSVFLMLVFCTVGNMQVFHGTLAVRGKDTVSMAAWSVAITVVVELFLIFSLYAEQQGFQGFLGFLSCIVSTEFCPESELAIQ